MTTTGDGDAGAIDPDFAGLFRPEDTSRPPTPEAMGSGSVAAESIVPEPVAAESIVPEPVAPEPVAPEPVAPEPSVDTGRLFRSQGVTGRDDAVLALASDHGGRLRTLERSDGAPAPAAYPAPTSSTPSDAGVAEVAGAAAYPIVIADRGPEAIPHLEADLTPDHPTSRRASRRGISAGAVYLIVLGATLLVGFADALLLGGIGWLTGAALVASSVYAALTVRREDDVVAIITPPIAILLVALTAGQVDLGAVEGSVLNRAVVTFFTLAESWMWTVGATVAALVIVLVRRRRG
jgi:hypothetical protein